MKSYYDVTQDLLGIRLSATRNSLWSVEGTIRAHAVRALNDGMAMFPITTRKVYMSAVVHTLGARIGLPPEITTPREIRLASNSYGDSRPIPHYTIIPTPFTSYLTIHDNITGMLEIMYDKKITYAPVDVTTYGWEYSGTLGHGLKLNTKLDPDLRDWRPSAQAKIHWTSTTREINITEFITRHVPEDPQSIDKLWKISPANTTQGTKNFSQNLVVSQLIPDEGALRPAVLQAQAVFYDFMITDRALYDQYTAIASEQALPLRDLFVLVGQYEARAIQAYRRTRQVPEPSGVHRRKPIPR